MTLSRRDLELGRMRELYAAAVDAQSALSDEALAASLAQTIARRPARAGWWVFAYGSLLWNPLFPFEDAHPAVLHGVHRRFCLWSKASRGTLAQPGLVMGLEPGGSCRGVVYRLPEDKAHDELKLLWRREMVTGAYHPRWMRVHVKSRSGRRALTALAFVIDRNHHQYACGLDLDEQARILACASGAFGSSADYLEHTRTALISHGVVDPYLEALAARVIRLRQR